MTKRLPSGWMSIEKIGRGLPFFSVPCCTHPGFVIFTILAPDAAQLARSSRSSWSRRHVFLTSSRVAIRLTDSGASVQLRCDAGPAADRLRGSSGATRLDELQEALCVLYLRGRRRLHPALPQGRRLPFDGWPTMDLFDLIVAADRQNGCVSRVRGLVTWQGRGAGVGKGPPMGGASPLPRPHPGGGPPSNRAFYKRVLAESFG